MEVDFERNRIRSKLEAACLDATSGMIHRAYGDRKAEFIGACSGTVVELGPGTGVNMRYYPPTVKVIGIEPNPHMHDRLRAAAAEAGVDLEIRTVRGERVDVPDESADAVVATLVLCGVEDPAAVLAEVRRMLVPGGRFFFMEHVVAPAGSFTRRLQRLVKRPHRWMANGCRVDQDTESLIRKAGFSDVELDRTDDGPAGLYVRHGIIGTASA